MSLPEGYRPPPSLPPRLAADAPVAPGISLVTACMNRNDNLARVLPGWLALDLAEVLVVDWSSKTPVAETLAKAGIADPRLRILRIEGEARWCLSYAFNAGFRAARHAVILKADADIDLSADFLTRNPLAPGQVVVGNWRKAGAGQQYVNGFFYIHRSDLAAVNGFNEYITSYGWDDDDLYDRLRDAGVMRRDVAPDTVRHLDHDDAARLGAAPAAEEAARTGWDDLAARPMYAIRANRFLATMMPGWDRHRTMLPLGRLAPDVLARAGAHPHRAPAHLVRLARMQAAYELLSWRAGLRVFDLTEAGLDLLLSCCRFEAITDLHVELALAAEAGAALLPLSAPRHLVADLPVPALAARPDAAAPLRARLEAIAAETGRALVLRAARRPAGLGGLDALPFVPAAHPLGPAAEAGLADAAQDLTSPVLRLPLGAEEIAALVPPLSAPEIARPRAGRITIEAQHGLGNRMRAIGSAAAVARATGRELRILWPEDAHCDAPFSALFEGNCAETEPDPLAAAEARGETVLIDMETGPGAARGAALTLEEGRDAFLRSAYVITHPACSWGAVNHGITATLRPCAEVRAMAEAAVPAAQGTDIALHVRMETQGGAFDSAENWSAEGHAAILHWRGQSHYARFMTRLDALLARREDAARLFLAADQPQVRAAFAARYGDDIAMLANPGGGRGGAALQAALADMLCLSRARHFLASPWSSFSEVALRLSSSITAYERSGHDF